MPRVGVQVAPDEMCPVAPRLALSPLHLACFNMPNAGGSFALGERSYGGRGTHITAKQIPRVDFGGL